MQQGCNGGPKFCSCHQCRRGRGGGRNHKVYLARRQQRRRVHETLKGQIGPWDKNEPYSTPPRTWSVGYTD